MPAMDELALEAARSSSPPSFEIDLALTNRRDWRRDRDAFGAPAETRNRPAEGRRRSATPEPGAVALLDLGMLELTWFRRHPTASTVTPLTAQADGIALPGHLRSVSYQPNNQG